MLSLQEQYDDAMFAFSSGDYAAASAGLKAILAADPEHFEAQLALGMVYFRQGDYAAAIEEGHKAEKMRPQEQLVHTNLSLFYVKAGNKTAAEHHGLQARVASWRGNMAPPPPGGNQPAPSELEIAKAKPEPVKLPTKFPETPWKKKT